MFSYAFTYPHYLHSHVFVVVRVLLLCIHVSQCCSKSHSCHILSFCLYFFGGRGIVSLHRHGRISIFSLLGPGKNVFEQQLSTMVLSPCRSLIQVAIILVFESVRLQPSFGQSGSMLRNNVSRIPHTLEDSLFTCSGVALYI